MGDKSVDRAAMAKAAQQIEAAHEKIFAIQKDLAGDVERLMLKWRATSAQAYHKGYLAFDGEYDKVKQGLDTIHKQLVQTQADYVKGEALNTDVAQNRFNAIINQA